MNFDAYDLDAAFHDEMFLPDGTPREHCEALYDALNRFLEDVYDEARIVADGVIPADVVRGCPQYRIEMRGDLVPAYTSSFRVCRIAFEADAAAKAGTPGHSLPTRHAVRGAFLPRQAPDGPGCRRLEFGVALDSRQGYAFRG